MVVLRVGGMGDFRGGKKVNKLSAPSDWASGLRSGYSGSGVPRQGEHWRHVL